MILKVVFPNHLQTAKLSFTIFVSCKHTLRSFFTRRKNRKRKFRPVKWSVY